MKPSPAKQAKQLQKILRDLASEATADANQYFFKETLLTYGVKTPEVNLVTKEMVSSLKGWDKASIFQLCELLFASGYSEDASVAAGLVYARRKEFVKADFDVFKKWIGKYINNWASCDKFCNHCVGSLLLQFPDLVSPIISWTNSPNRWLRRAAAVSLIVPGKQGKFLDTIIDVATRLLVDKDDLVQKGYGWMLKEAANHHEGRVFEFIMLNKAEMPRVALRYAIEKMPEDLKREAMSRD